jgi:hypothetical protein
VPVVKFEVASKTRGFIVDLDAKTKVVFVQGKASVTVPAGEHILRWWIAGDSGAGITITATTGARELFKVNSKIPPGVGSHTNFKRFTV